MPLSTSQSFVGSSSAGTWQQPLRKRDQLDEGLAEIDSHDEVAHRGGERDDCIASDGLIAGGESMILDNLYRLPEVPWPQNVLAMLRAQTQETLLGTTR
jgi:hypothetical protein